MSARVRLTVDVDPSATQPQSRGLKTASYLHVKLHLHLHLYCRVVGFFSKMTLWLTCLQLHYPTLA